MKISLKEITNSGMFIKNVNATEEDIRKGNAAFDSKNDGIPLDIEIPQYAMHINENGSKTQVIIIQAESLGGLRIIGARIVEDGSYLVGTEGEFIFLGNDSNSIL